ncbi:MAG: OmpH family outer membrane protein, partial [Myxococcota bacterium]
MKFRMFLCAAIMAGYGLTAAPALAAPQIGYVDLQRAILQVDEGKRAQEKLKKTLEKKQKDLEAKLAPRKKSLEALQKKVAEGKGSASDRAEFAKARAELQEVAM